MYKNFSKSTKEGITHYHIPGDILSADTLLEYAAKAVVWLTTEMQGMENIIIHFNWLNHCPFAYLLKQTVQCKTILTKHCIPWRDLTTNHYQVFLRLNNQFENGSQRLSLSHPALFREQFGYNAIDHIICVTQIAKKSLQKMLRYPNDKVSVIYNGINPAALLRQRNSKSYLRMKYGFADDETILLFAGSINERKGANDLAETFDRLAAKHPDKKMRLVLAGSGDHNKLLKNVKTNWSRITITGRLSKKQLYHFYAMSDIGVVPSYVEQCSYTTIEMMCVGLPLMVADVDGLKEIVPDDCGLKI